MDTKQVTEALQKIFNEERMNRVEVGATGLAKALAVASIPRN